MAEIQCHPTITKCHGTEKKNRYSGVFVIGKTPLQQIMVSNKIIRYSGITKLNQAKQWDTHHAKQSTDLRVNS